MQQAENALVVGAGSGIGAALVNSLANRGQRVFAISRRPVSSSDGSVVWLNADASDAQSLAQALEEVPSTLRLLCVTIGHLHSRNAGPEKRLSLVDTESLTTTFHINAATPLDVLRQCEARLTHEGPSAAMVLSAQVGSIGDNRLGGWYGYRMAKAALNMGIKTAAIEFERVRKAPVVCAVHPGTTATALSGPFIKRRRAAVTSVLETGERLAELALSLGPQDNGRFIKWDRSEIEW